MNKAKYYLGICAVLNMTTELCLTFYVFPCLLGNTVVSFFRVHFKVFKQIVKYYPSYM